MGDSFYRLVLSSFGIVGGLLLPLRPVILCLHSVAGSGVGADPFQSEISITDVFLDRLICDLKQRGIPILDLADAVARIAAADFRPFVVFTFDDGYKDVYQNGFPIFRRHDVPFTMFLTTGLVERSIPTWWHVLEKTVMNHEKINLGFGEVPIVTTSQKRYIFGMLRERFRHAGAETRVKLFHELDRSNDAIGIAEGYSVAVTWDMVREMRESGLARFGCHTHTHPLLSMLSRGDISTELSEARSRMVRETGTAPEFFAYPFGQPEEIGSDAPDLVARAGFRAALTTVSQPVGARTCRSLFFLPRILLARKAQMASVVRGYMTGLPALLRGGALPLMQMQSQ